MTYKPKFKYKEIEATMEAGQRRYNTPAGRFASITTVLSGTQPAEKSKAIEDWRKSMGEASADEAVRRAATHGTAVHLLMERHFKHEELMAPDEDGNPISDTDFKAYRSLQFLIRRIDEVWGIEVPLFSTMLRVAGRCDMIAKYKGIPSIIDFKTSTKLKTREDIRDYAIQLAFYAIAHNEMFGTDIQQGVILMAAQGGFPMEFIFTVDEALDELVDRIEQFYTLYP